MAPQALLQTVRESRELGLGLVLRAVFWIGSGCGNVTGIWIGAAIRIGIWIGMDSAMGVTHRMTENEPWKIRKKENNKNGDNE